MLNTQKRYGKTSKKMISLTDEGREQLQQFADSHNMSFSAAIETLALIGMEADLTTLIVPLLKEVVQAGLNRHFNRLAKLTVTAAAESAIANNVTLMLLLQTIRQEAVSHPEDFEQRIAVDFKTEGGLNFRIREIYNQMHRLARTRQKKLMRQPLTELLADYGPELEEEE
jgi:hypothetical protein